MDETLRPEGERRPDHLSYWAPLAEELPPGFFGLRLLLQPAGTPLELTRPEVLVGRHSCADVRLPLPDVSRRHCRFVFAGGRWQVFDLQSLNGTYVNDERVEQSDLRAGDRVRLGGFTFLVELLRPAADEAPLAQRLFPDGKAETWLPRRKAS
jgi:pSer/pThr/pTyr-binding forkhead associated (FHA) protein